MIQPNHFMKSTLLACYVLIFVVTSQTQSATAQPTTGSQELTLEAIFADNLLQQETVSSIRWMNDGRYYTAQVSEDTVYYQHILRYDVTTGEAVDTLVNGRQLVPRDAPDTPALAYDNYELSPPRR